MKNSIFAYVAFQPIDNKHDTHKNNEVKKVIEKNNTSSLLILDGTTESTERLNFTISLAFENATEQSKSNSRISSPASYTSTFHKQPPVFVIKGQLMNAKYSKKLEGDAFLKNTSFFNTDTALSFNNLIKPSPLSTTLKRTFFSSISNASLFSKSLTTSRQLNKNLDQQVDFELNEQSNIKLSQLGKNLLQITPVMSGYSSTFTRSITPNSSLPQSIESLPDDNSPTNLIIVGWRYSKITVGNLFQKGDFSLPCLNCVKKNAYCLFTANRSFLNKANAIFFHASLLSVNDLPPTRNPQQKWIFYTKEAPRHHITGKVNLTLFDTLFNITVTYSSNATVLAAYGKCTKSNFNNLKNSYIAKSIAGKTKTAAWFVSHCYTENKREDYVKQLTQYVDVDIYGECGTLHCPFGLKECNTLLEKHYWFYLSFENSNCKDYVTEKVFNILTRNINIVPVVYGGANYSHILPPHSFISAWDYKSPEELSEYLIYLTQNKTAYTEYFRWRKSYACRNWQYIPELCSYLHANINRQSVVPSIGQFWSHETQCPEKSRRFLR